MAIWFRFISDYCTVSPRESTEKHFAVICAEKEARVSLIDGNSNNNNNNNNNNSNNNNNNNNNTNNKN